MKLNLVLGISRLFTLSGSTLSMADAGDDAKFAHAAFACAVLAAESSESSGNRGLASRLALKAMPRAQTAADATVQVFKSNAGYDLGPLSDFIRSAPASYFVGLQFAQAQTEIEELLPKAGEAPGSYEIFKARKETEADLEFSHRNCTLLVG